MNLKQLEAFVSAAEQQSFRRAAERLHTTQPNISTRIASLEERLGVTLMERDAGSVRLTPIGEVILAHARQVLRARDALIEAVDDVALFEGTIRLGVTEIIAHSWLGDFLKALKARFPNVAAELTVDVSANLSVALFNHSLDLALQNGPFAREISGTIPIGRFGYAWVAAPDLEIPPEPATVEDLAPHPILTHARGTQPHAQVAAHLAQAKGRMRVVPSNHMSACLQMTVDGLGVACIPETMVSEAVRAGRLRKLNLDWSPDDLVFAARYDAEAASFVVQEAARIASRVAQTHEKIKISYPAD